MELRPGFFFRVIQAEKSYGKFVDQKGVMFDGTRMIPYGVISD